MGSYSVATSKAKKMVSGTVLGLAVSFMVVLLCLPHTIASEARLPDSLLAIFSAPSSQQHTMSRKLLAPACLAVGCLAECSSCTMFPNGMKDSNHPEAHGVCTLLREVYACTIPGSSIKDSDSESVPAAKSQESKRRTVNGMTLSNSSGSASSFVDKHGFTVVNNGDVLWSILY